MFSNTKAQSDMLKRVTGDWKAKDVDAEQRKKMDSFGKLKC